MNKFFLSLFAVLCCALCIDCSKVSANSVRPQAIYGADSNYYLGLQALEEGNETKAIKLFTRAARRASDYISLKSYEELTKIGDAKDRIFFCDKLLEKFDTEEAILIAARAYASCNEFDKLFFLTESIDVQTCSNELAALFIKSLHHKNDRTFSDKLYSWFSAGALSTHHDSVFSQIVEPNFLAQQNISNSISPTQFEMMQFRVLVFRRSYTAAFRLFETFREKIDTGELKIFPHLVSDIGRAFLYANSTSAESVNFFVQVAENAEKSGDNLLAFYARFYAARFSDRTKNYRTAFAHYEKAMSAASNLQDGEKFDNALWYFLNCVLDNFPDEVFDAVTKYCAQWDDASYFDDFFEKLAAKLFANSQWKEFKEFLFVLNGFASKETVAHYAYVYARLLQLKIVNAENSAEREAKKFFELAASEGNAFYYSILSAVQLGFSDKKIIDMISAKNSDKFFLTDKDAEYFVRGFAEFGLHDYVYENWLYFYEKDIRFSPETNEILASFLQQAGNDDNKYFPQSIRIAHRSSLKRTQKMSQEFLQLLYPKDYEQIVNEVCENFNLPTELLFALIRSESFFQADAKSSVGAMGLTQLMDFTAKEVADALQRTEYDVTNPADNIFFGAYYLNNLISRLNGSVIQALSAYNGGIGNVRRWLNRTHPDIRKIINGNCDLFLEGITFTETRNYGRNVISAAMIYAMLHYEKSAVALADEFLK